MLAFAYGLIQNNFQMKRIYFFLSFCLWASLGFAQNFILVDQVTQARLAGVKVYSADKQVGGLTNSNGELSISGFESLDSIAFKFSGYELQWQSFEALQNARFRVELVPSEITLEVIVISPNRWEEEEMEMPARVEKLDMRAVALQNPQTAADLLGTTGFVHIQKSQMAGGSPMLRGFATNRVMLVIDGVRMNNAIFRTGNLQNVISLDANAMQSAEVLFGPGAVMYGSDAIGGVMDFRSLDPTLSLEKKPLFTGNAMLRTSSANFEKTAHVDLNFGTNRWGFLTSATVSDYDDLVAGKNGNDYFLRPTYQTMVNGRDTILINSNTSKQIESGYGQLNLMQKIRFKPNANWDFDYAFHYSATTNAPRYDRLTLDSNEDGIFDNAEWYYGPQKWMMNRLGMVHSNKTKIYDRLRLVAAMQNYDESRHDRKFGRTSLRNQLEHVDAYSINLDLDKKFGHRFDLYYGLEGVYNKVGSKADRVDQVTGIVTSTNTRYPNGATWQAYGLYGNLKYELSSKLSLNGGLRMSIYQIVTDFDTTLFPYPIVHAENRNQALNGSLGLVFRPNRLSQFYLNTSTGFRAPNVDDIGKVFDSAPGRIVVPNPALKSEYAYNAEAGFAKVFGNRLKLDASIFYTYLDQALALRESSYDGQDSIVFEGVLSQVSAIQNISYAYVYGLQLGLDMNIGKGFSFNGSLSYQKGKELSADGDSLDALRHAPPSYATAHLLYKRKKLSLDLYGIGYQGMSNAQLPIQESTSAFAKDENGLPFVPAYATLNFKAAWFVNQHLTFNAGIENITNQLYRPYGSGISAAGRNLIFGIRCKW